MTQYTLHDSLGYWMNRVASLMHETFDQAVSDLDMTAAQWAVMSAIARAKATTPGEIADHIGIHGGSVTRLLDRLTDKGFVERVPHATDRRAITVRLTTSGKRIVPELERRSKEINDHFLEMIDPSLRPLILPALKNMAAR